MGSDGLTSNKKAIIAMSGGVDSSVAALLSRDAGLECVGVTMKLFENEDLAAGAKKDVADCSGKKESCS